MKNLLWLFLFAPLAFGQAVRVDIPLLTSGPNVPTAGGPFPQALWLSNATIQICTHPATLNSCSYVPTYTDVGSGTQCPGTQQLVALPGNTCSANAGIVGNIGVWYAGGTVDYIVTSSYGTYGPYTVTGINGGGNYVSTVQTLPQTMIGTLAGPGFASMVASTTITSALIANACTGTAPGTFVLPYGTVNLAAALTIPSLCTLQGQGPGISTIKVAANTNFAAGAIVNSSQSLNKPGTLDTSIHLRNFTLDMNTANQSGFSYAIWMKNIAYSSMEHVEVNGSGVLFTYAANINDLTLASYQHDLLFDGDWFHGAGITLAHDSDSLTITGQHVKVVNSTLGPSTDTGLASFGEGALDYIVSNNYFLNNQAVCGIAVGPGPNNVPAPPNARYATSQMTITGNTFTCSDISGNSYAVAISLGTGFTISGNVATMTPQAGSQTSPTISLEAVSDATVTGNQINGAKYDGIDIIAQGQETTQNVTVTGNVIRNPSQSCIYLLSSAGASAPTYLQNVSVTGNSCVDPGATAGITIAQASHVSPSEMGNYNNVQVEGNGILDDRGGSATMTYGIAYNGFPTVSVAGNNVSGAVTASYSTPNNGAVSTYTNYLQSADRMQAGLITTSAGPSVTGLAASL